MATREKPVPIDQEILERLNRGILQRTGAYRTDDHFVLRSGRHTSEYVAKALVTTEPTFTEGLGDIIAAHFSGYQVDLVLTTGYGAGLLGHCVARAHLSRPRFIFATKGRTAGGRTEVILQPEYRKFFAEGGRVLIVEDIVTTGETVKQLIKLVEGRVSHVSPGHPDQPGLRGRRIRGRVRGIKGAEGVTWAIVSPGGLWITLINSISSDFCLVFQYEFNI
ncbi:MAG: hypothetical protein HYS69_14360 [candidate division NC10 bacterium]|nr:hypothetical protein [candidate division NC10 bacterium]